jgi:hypothetical protein
VVEDGSSAATYRGRYGFKKKRLIIHAMKFNSFNDMELIGEGGSMA